MTANQQMTSAELSAKAQGQDRKGGAGADRTQFFRSRTKPDSTLSVFAQQRDEAAGILDGPSQFPLTKLAALHREQLISQIHGHLAQQPLGWVIGQLDNALDRVEVGARTDGNLEPLRRDLARISDELHTLNGTTRHPSRDPRHTGHPDRDWLHVEGEVAQRTAGVEPIDPRGVTETRKALKASREKGVRYVRLTWDSIPPTSDATFDVTGPSGDGELVILVRSGCPELNVVSGNVTIDSVGGSGYGITVGAGANATVLIGPKQKLAVYALPGSTVNVHPDETARGYHRVADEANYTLHGTAHRIGLTSDPS